MMNLLHNGSGVQAPSDTAHSGTKIIVETGAVAYSRVATLIQAVMYTLAEPGQTV